MCRKPRRNQAFSIMELMLACSLFMLLLGVIFLFFRFGTRAFITANQRQGVQADGLRVMDGLQADLKRTAGKSVRFLNNTNSTGRTRTVDTVEVHRDVISLISLKDWTNPNDTENFDLSGAQPRWNRYWIYYATNDNDRGSLIRLKVDPHPAPISPTPLTIGKLLQICHDNPNSNLFEGQTPHFSYLCRNVYDFQVSQQGNNTFRISLSLQEKRQLRPDGGIVQGMETYQLQMDVRPENTFPQDLINL